LIIGGHHYQTVHITIDNGKVTKINNVNGILPALRRLGMDLEPSIAVEPTNGTRSANSGIAVPMCLPLPRAKLSAMHEMR